MRLYTAYQTKNPAYTRSKVCTPVGIMVHTTDGQNSYAKRYVDAPDILGKNENGNHWNKGTATKCMHAFVGKDKDGAVVVVNTLPYHKPCKGCGSGSKGSCNYDPRAHVQFEICEGPDSDTAYYREAITAAEEYCVYLCRLFGWTADAITSHAEAAYAGYASDHADPAPYMRVFGDSMDDFRKRVAKRLAGSTERFPPHKVTDTTPLNLRSGPATSFAKRGSIPVGEIVEAVPAQGSWMHVIYTDGAGKRLYGYASAKYLEAVPDPDPAPPVEPTDAEKLAILWAHYKAQTGGGA